ncbi:MAG: hypothetical protein AAFX06_23135, partial [Planctomycetota bacterium]
MLKLGRQTIVCLLLSIGFVNSALGQFTNPSFETGDFTGWITQELSRPFSPLRVGTVGDQASFGSNTLMPTDGTFAVMHGFDGAQGTIRVAQDVMITGNSISFDHRGGWSLTFGAIEDRLFQVNIETAGGGSVLASHTILRAEAGDSVSDTGTSESSVDVSAFVGQTVRVSFDWIIPENFTGPAFFHLDNVRLSLGLDPQV